MFFSVSLTKKDNFPQHFTLGKFVINADNGWNSTFINGNSLVYKGYCDQFNLEKNLELIISKKVPEFTGNFCIFLYDGSNLKIFNDLNRSFPIFYDANEITNLYALDNAIATDKLCYCDLNFNIHQEKFDLFGNLDLEILPEEIVIEKIHTILDKKISNFLSHNHLPVKSFVSGGIDSMLVYSYVSKYTNASIISGEIFEFDYFFLKNHSHLKKYWAYNQIHHFLAPTLLTSGAPGDEFMLRSPVTANLYCIGQNTNIIELLDNDLYKDCLHSLYFSMEKHLKIFSNQLTKKNKLIKTSRKFLNYEICKNVHNDFQHHHIGNTLTFTPLRDIEITKLLLQLPTSSAFDQIMNSKISKKLIERNNPKLLEYLSSKKNSLNYKENLIGLVI